MLCGDCGSGIFFGTTSSALTGGCLEVFPPPRFDISRRIILTGARFRQFAKSARRISSLSSGEDRPLFPLSLRGEGRGEGAFVNQKFLVIRRPLTLTSPEGRGDQTE